ncbi:RNA-binding protein [Nitzschia inconspicua]|uniref:RNA-binding protein n=1 Tax=Nitzschia inconspicua TaxID=303405 RepID=A0A9K3KLF7_9STRA|nr:RNA-binding protein [Nitzschia inconspicua]
MPDQDEEQQLRERLLKRKYERQACDAAAAAAAGSKDGNPPKKHHPSSASATTATTASASTTTPQQQTPDKKGQLPPSMENDEQKAPVNQDEHDSSLNNSNSRGEEFSAQENSNIHDREQRESDKSRNCKRERRREYRGMSRRDDRGGGGGGPYGGYNNFRDPHYYDDGRQHPPPGRWERDMYAGGGRGRPRGRYYDERRGPPPPPPEFFYREGRRDRSPVHRPRRGGRSPLASSSRHSHPSNPGDWSYGGSYHSNSRSRSNSPGSTHGTKGRKIVDSTPRSRDGSKSTSRGSRDRRRDDRRYGSGSRGRDRRRSRQDDYSSDSYSSSSSSSLSSASSSSDSEGSTSKRKNGSGDVSQRQYQPESAFSRDQRTVFVSQLVMRTTEKDVRRYFKKKLGCKVNQVILLRDRRSRTHKGCAYVEFARIEDVATAVGVSGQPPDFQRFPLLIKASEAEKNYAIPASTSVVTASMMGTKTTFAPFFDKNGKQVEAQKVYVGGLDATVTEEHLFALFSQFGELEKVTMQMDVATNTSRGYAFLSFRDPMDANLAIQTMMGQVIAGRPLKTGWANQSASIPGVPIVTSDEYPEDASARAQKAFQMLGQLMGGTSDAAINAMALSATAEKAIDAALGHAIPPTPLDIGATAGANATPSRATHSASSVPTVAEARENFQATIAAQKSAAAAAATTTGIAPAIATRHILVYNMFDKDEETDPGWEKDIEDEFCEEAAKFGKIERSVVMHKEVGGKIYATFETVDGAAACAKNLAGRWFDKRQLRVDFVDESEVPQQKTT